MAECSSADGPCLLSRIDAGTAAVNSVSVIVGEDSVISASDDKYVCALCSRITHRTLIIIITGKCR